MTEKQKAAAERRRRKGYMEYIRRIRREKAKKKKAEAKQKERERIKRQKEREKLKKKRPVGRPKKKGPKKKYKKKKTVKKNPVGRPYIGAFNYKIISCRNGKQNKLIGKYRSIEDAYDAFNVLIRNDENVILPTLLTGEDKLFNSIDEYILIEKNPDKDSNLLRNEYGKLVEHRVDKDGWIIIDKQRYNKEETFWVYGFNNKNERKTFLWIYENLILTDIETCFDFKRLIIYKNKLVIKSDSDTIDMVICKNESDSIRLYNKIEEYIKRDKIKQVLFLGNLSKLSDRRRKLEDEIMELTGWDRRKVQMKATKYHLK